jgi:hypothetical protein
VGPPLPATISDEAGVELPGKVRRPKSVCQRSPPYPGAGNLESSETLKRVGRDEEVFGVEL